MGFGVGLGSPPAVSAAGCGCEPPHCARSVAHLVRVGVRVRMLGFGFGLGLVLGLELGLD